MGSIWRMSEKLSVMAVCMPIQDCKSKLLTTTLWHSVCSIIGFDDIGNSDDFNTDDLERRLQSSGKMYTFCYSLLTSSAAHDHHNVSSVNKLSLAVAHLSSFVSHPFVSFYIMLLSVS